MKVQRIRSPETDEASWIVLDDAYLPIEPITVYLAFLESLGRLPHTRREISEIVEQALEEYRARYESRWS